MELGELFAFEDDTSPLMMLIWILPIILFVFYGQRIQLMVSSSEIKKKIRQLDQYGNESMKKTLLHVKSIPGVSGDYENKLGIMADYFTIPPMDMDPAGVVTKVRHVIRTRENHTRRQLESVLRDSDALQVSRVQTLLEVTASLRMIHRIVNHMYLTAKKQNNYPLILPLQMMLPTVMEEAEAMRGALEPFGRGQPVGDGVGPAVVGLLMRGLKKEDIAYQTVMARTTVRGRDVLLVKAQGPAPVVGRPDEAVQHILQDSAMDAIIMVDAALRLEGEASGTVSVGFGAAIGGSGAERFRIEELATQKGVPVFCVVVKQSVKESVTLMTDTIHKRVSDAHGALLDMIQDAPGEGSIMVIGVGNTGGIGQ